MFSALFDCNTCDELTQDFVNHICNRLFTQHDIYINSKVKIIAEILSILLFNAKGFYLSGGPNNLPLIKLLNGNVP